MMNCEDDNLIFYRLLMYEFLKSTPLTFILKFSSRCSKLNLYALFFSIWKAYPINLVFSLSMCWILSMNKYLTILV